MCHSGSVANDFSSDWTTISTCGVSLFAVEGVLSVAVSTADFSGRAAAESGAPAVSVPVFSRGLKTKGVEATGTDSFSCCRRFSARMRSSASMQFLDWVEISNDDDFFYSSNATPNCSDKEIKLCSLPDRHHFHEIVYRYSDRGRSSD